jgi:hypothetical protein
MADYDASDFGPSTHANKHREMAVRRAYDLNSGLMDALAEEGDVESLKRLHRSVIIEHKLLRDIFDFNSVEWRDKEAWEWTIDHWYSGGLKRSVVATMQSLHPDNIKAIKGKVNELYSRAEV